MNKLKMYFQSYSTKVSYFAAILMYISYSAMKNQWKNEALIVTCLFFGIVLPFFSRVSNKIDEKISFKTASVTPGRVGRFIFQFLFNYIVFFLFQKYNVIEQNSISDLGGIVGITFLTTSASQGIQYIAIAFANREIGNPNRNVIIGLSINIIVTAIAACGIAIIKPIFILIGILSAVILFLIGFLSDIRSKAYPKNGIGIFFGTFNPFHNTHLELIKNVLRERHLEKIYLHSTIVPKLHLDALRKEEIEIKEYEHGMRIYQKTDKADVHVNYFPTGNKFYEAETRKNFMELAIKEAGLEDKVEILYLPEIYEKKGFYGIIDYVKSINKGKSIHGVHGSDLGGMWIRRIYDESGWIYPYAVKRINKVSATAIRNGAKNMAPHIIEAILEHLNNNESNFLLSGINMCIKNGVLEYDGNEKK